eukprot:7391567-Prymnesium_polylepis.2
MPVLGHIAVEAAVAHADVVHALLKIVLRNQEARFERDLLPLDPRLGVVRQIWRAETATAALILAEREARWAHLPAALNLQWARVECNACRPVVHAQAAPVVALDNADGGVILGELDVPARRQDHVGWTRLHHACRPLAAEVDTLAIGKVRYARKGGAIALVPLAMVRPAPGAPAGVPNLEWPPRFVVECEARRNFFFELVGVLEVGAAGNVRSLLSGADAALGLG